MRAVALLCESLRGVLVFPLYQRINRNGEHALTATLNHFHVSQIRPQSKSQCAEFAGKSQIFIWTFHMFAAKIVSGYFALDAF